MEIILSIRNVNVFMQYKYAYACIRPFDLYKWFGSAVIHNNKNVCKHQAHVNIK